MKHTAKNLSSEDCKSKQEILENEEQLSEQVLGNAEATELQEVHDMIEQNLGHDEKEDVNEVHINESSVDNEEVITKCEMFNGVFSSWEEFERSLSVYCAATLQPLRVRSSETLVSMNKRRVQHGQPPMDIPLSFQIYKRAYRCTHGINRKSRSQGKRAAQTNRFLRCNANMVATVKKLDSIPTVRETGFAIVVTNQRSIHNHVLHPSLFSAFSKIGNELIEKPLSQSEKKRIRKDFKEKTLYPAGGNADGIIDRPKRSRLTEDDSSKPIINQNMEWRQELKAQLKAELYQELKGEISNEISERLKEIKAVVQEELESVMNESHGQMYTKLV